MKSLLLPWLLVMVLGMCSAVGHADTSSVESRQVYLLLSYDWLDVADADFDNSLSAEAGVLWPLQQRFYLEAAVTGINDASTPTQEDNTGSYQLTLDSVELLAGIHYQTETDWMDSLVLFGRGGLLAYRMEITLDEAFYGLKPSGSDTASDSGWGFYVGAGVLWDLKNRWLLRSEFTYKQRSDFLDDSSKPFDVQSTGINIGIARTF